jgi:lipopolysaccharide biosynthesis glycosyltransferase
MTGKSINILAAIDSNYLKPMIVMLRSLFATNRNEQFQIYLMHSKLSDEEIGYIKEFIESKGHDLTLLKVDEELFRDAPISSYYTKEVYFRLLAPFILPDDLERILYLDADIIINQPISDLYDMDLDGYYLATAKVAILIAEWFHRKRLSLPKGSGYFNSGVLLFNLDQIRKNISLKNIFDCIESNKSKLYYPDQDVLNIVYHEKIRFIDKHVYNYNTELFWLDGLTSFGQKNMQWLQRSVAIIHFLGKKKPWDPLYKGALKELYTRYDIL